MHFFLILIQLILVLVERLLIIMSTHEDNILNNYRLFGGYGQVDSEDTELAFQLQNATSMDQGLLEKIVYKYSARLYRFVKVLLFYRKMVNPSNDEILNTLRIIFEKSITNIKKFHGSTSVSDWLFEMSFSVVADTRTRNWLPAFFKKKSYRNPGVLREVVSDNCNSIDSLPDKYRLPLILRYLFTLDLHDIADILHIQVGEVHLRLNNARQQLLTDPIAAHFDRQIMAFMDGLLDENPDELNQLNLHLADCDLCQRYAKRINDLEMSLTLIVKERWSLPEFSKDDLDTLILSILSNKQSSKVWWKVQLPLRSSIWILGICAVLVGFIILSIRINPDTGEFPQAKLTAIPTLPPVIESESGRLLPPNHGIVPNPPQYIMPAFSSDGKWAVFVVIQRDPNSQMYLKPTIELYNRETNSVQLINESTPSITLHLAFGYLAPSISADGRWIAYADLGDEPRTPGSPCTTGIQFTCTDIFLYDRETRQTRLITKNADGMLANGDSFSPIISADGQWVAFWSASNNLVYGLQRNCESEQNISCAYIYLYNQTTGILEQIPISTATTGYMIGADRISLSADGRFVGFTLTKDRASEMQGDHSQDKIEPPLPSDRNDMEAIVYDRQTGKYELENQTQDGILGNGNSTAPVLSMDGRFVAFSSASSNLVPGDINGFTDVFIRDRMAGTIELVSHALDGSPSNGPTTSSRYGLDISSDGRYIVFGSEATNLSNTAPVECNPTGLVCNILYLYDRQMGSSELINDPPTGNFSYFPQISSDGRWVSFTLSESNCPMHQYQCSDVMLYDLSRTWTTNLTKSTQGILMTPWSYSENFLIPKELSVRTDLAFSPNNSLLALAGNDSFVGVWQLADIDTYLNRNPILKLGGSEELTYTSLAFSPGGEWLAVGTTTRKVFIWKIPEGRLVYTLEEESGPIKDVSFSADGNELVISSNTQAELWQIEENQIVKVNSFSYGNEPIYDVAISPSGNLVASARSDGTVWLQALPEGSVVSRPVGSRGEINKILFSTDGNLLATRSIAGSINIWQINRILTGASFISHINTFQTDNTVGPISFSPDDRYLATSTLSGGVLLWDVYTGDVYQVSPSIPDGRLDTLAFSGRGDRLAGTIVNGDLAIWSINPGSSTTYFVHALRDSYGDSGPLPMAPANDLLMLRESGGLSAKQHLALDQVAAALAFPLLIPTHIPSNIRFTEARVNNDGSAWLEYDASDMGGIQAGLYIYEQIIGDSQPPTMAIGANAAVDQIPIVMPSWISIAEYVQGDWSWSRDDNSKINTYSDSWEWISTRPTQRLRWEQQGIFIAMFYEVTTPFERILNHPVKDEFVALDRLLTQQDLVNIAKGLLPFSKLGGLSSDDIISP
jgi:WD40 repeat protein/DNA-directed RNA polymerase specialized sigma24 family protein